MTRDPTSRLDALLDAALEKPPSQRRAFVADSCKEDASLRARLEHLLTLAESTDGFLDRPLKLATSPQEAASPASASLAAGQRFGAYQLVRPLGAGGMGEVWLATRVDGGFAQTVAIKCLRASSVDQLARFDQERAILATLEHPHIARLYDGGSTPDGRPYMVMEYVEGENLIDWCERHAASLETRLGLFLQVCDAVAHAHTHLVVHRDLKPANIIVNADAGVKLLDFGIARLLENSAGRDTTLAAHLSPGYAAPEQLMGGPIGTSADVHALGVTLFQLLTGRLPWAVAELPLGVALQRLLTQDPPPASSVAAADAPVPARALRGDLDAIIARTLRREPEARYADVRALADDLRRHLRHAPVQARSGARLYVARRFLRRYWMPLAGVGAAFAVVTTAAVLVAMQAGRATAEAERATAIKDYLVRVFAASDPRIAADAPAGQITARELLDAATGRIDAEFGDRPALQIELLGLTARIYRALRERERFEALHARHMNLARTHFGEAHPVFIEGRLLDVDDAILQHDYAAAGALLDELDPVLRRARLDDSVLRARWWLRRGNVLEADASQWQLRMAALREAARLFERHAPDSPDHVVTLANIGAAWWESSAPEANREARDWTLRAAEAAERSAQRDDGELLTIYANLGHIQDVLGDAEGADFAFGRATELAARTFGPDDARYWHAGAAWASTLHARGQRERAMALLEPLVASLPAEPAIDQQDHVGLVLTLYGNMLVREGNSAAAVPVLEAARRGYERANRGYRLTYLDRVLGEALEGSGRHAEAREHFQRSLEGVRSESGDELADAVLTARERWARFLLASGDVEGAEAEFRSVLADGAVAASSVRDALCHAGLARIQLERGQPSDAVAHSARAMALIDDLPSGTDVRTAPGIWLVHAAALSASGDRAAARRWANDAAAALREYDAPQSRQRLEAEQLAAQLRER